MKYSSNLVVTYILLELTFTKEAVRQRKSGESSWVRLFIYSIRPMLEVGSLLASL